MNIFNFNDNSDDLKQIGDLQDELKIDVKDEQLIEITNQWLKIADSDLQELNSEFEARKKYYLYGTDIPAAQRQIVDNRIFMSIETIIPIATSGLPVPNVLSDSDKIEEIEQSKTWEKILMSIYRRQKMSKILEKSVRFLNLAKYTVIKTRYNSIKEDIETYVVHPSRCLFNNKRDISTGFDWFGEKITVSAERLIKMFPKEKQYILAQVKNKTATLVTYIEFWTNDTLVIRFKDKILSKSTNPNFEKSNKKNFLDEPRMPYFVTSMFDLGETIAGSTSLIDQAIPLQDSINKRKSQIDKNADMVNGKIMGTGVNGLTKQEFSQVDWTNPAEGIFMSQGEIGDIQRISGQPLPQFVENDMLHSQSELDNIMGTHSTTRGEREGRETATGRNILRESDRGRIDIFGRRMEEVVEDLFKYWTQLVKVYFVNKRRISFLQDEIKESFTFNKDSIGTSIDIEIIPGTLIPEDNASKQQRMLTLANAQKISTFDLHKEMGIKNPRTTAKNAYLELQGRFDEIIPETGSANQEGTDEQVILKAEDENKRMLAGEPQAPFEQADANHIAAHQQVIENPEFANQPEEIKQLFLEHIQAEVAIVEQNTKQTV